MRASSVHTSAYRIGVYQWRDLSSKSDSIQDAQAKGILADAIDPGSAVEMRITQIVYLSDPYPCGAYERMPRIPACHAKGLITAGIAHNKIDMIGGLS